MSNVFGTFYQNCVSLSFYYPESELRGKFGHIALRNIYGQNAPRIPEYGKGSDYPFSFIWVDGLVEVNTLTIENMERVEEIAPVETIRVEPRAKIRNMSVAHVSHQNKLGVPLPLMRNHGTIENLYLYNLDAGEDQVLVNAGTIGKLVEN